MRFFPTVLSIFTLAAMVANQSLCDEPEIVPGCDAQCRIESPSGSAEKRDPLTPPVATPWEVVRTRFSWIVPPEHPELGSALNGYQMAPWIEGSHYRRSDIANLPKSGLPIVICHGFGANRSFAGSLGSRSLAMYLSNCGFQVWEIDSLNMYVHGWKTMPKQFAAAADYQAYSGFRRIPAGEFGHLAATLRGSAEYHTDHVIPLV